MKRNRTRRSALVFLGTVLLLCFFCGCEKSPKPVSVTSTEDRVGYSYGYANLSLERREGWQYKIEEYKEGCSDFGIRFAPEGSKEEGFIYLYFGVNTHIVGCGTGIQTKEITVAGRPASAGTYDNNDHWTYLWFSDCTGKYGATNPDTDWWEKQGAEAMEILETAEISLGEFATEAQILKTAENHVSGDVVSSGATFDCITGIWTVTLDTNDGRQTVKTDALGRILESPQS